MIPLKLHIKNFVSYGAPQDINFEPYSLMCLSGKNGHGKSALLDALTWVLWGQARKASGVAKADEGLLHLGQTHMMVSLDFLCNGTLYRVKREYTQSLKKGQSNLEFGILDKETGDFRALTDKTIRATQAKIIQTIGLDYEGFINSAFLRQGHSHEFSKKTPKERKDILASILGLEHFEKVRRLALDTAKEALAEKAQASAVFERLEEDLKQKKIIQERLKTIEGALKEVEQKEKELQVQLELHKKRSQQAQAEKVEHEKIRIKKEHLTKVIADEVAFISSQTTTWRDVLRRQRKEGSVSVEKEREHVQKDLKNIQVLAAKKLQTKEAFLLKKEILRSETLKMQEAHKYALEKLEKALHSCSVEIKSTKQKQQELTQRSVVKTKELEELLETLTTKKKSTQVIDESAIATHEKTFERRKGYYHTFVSKATSLKSLLSSLVQKKELIQNSEQAVCPLCEQVTDKEKLSEKFVKEEHLRTHQLNRLSTVCSNLKAALIEEHKALEGLKKNREQHKVVQAQLIELEKHHAKGIQEASEIAKGLKLLEEQKALLVKQLQSLEAEKLQVNKEFDKKKNEEPFVTLARDVALLEKSLSEISYDPQKEQALLAQLTALDKKQVQQKELIKEFALQDQRKKTIQEKCATTRTLKKELTALLATAKDSSILDDKQLIEQEQLLAQSLSHLTKEKENFIHQKGSLEAQSAALKQKEHEYKHQAKVVKECAKKGEDYTAIASAFSKDGIQALLIEDALPEIEEEANNILSRLTDNQAHITIESLKDTKSGKTKETLDIKISDAVGVRPYEMFSGGEAFRIDFSLRVALSKLLARRAGTALQTLIIDEGFGSQDEDGLSNIMEALHTIQDDFSKVIIVSHLSSLKEQFPVHFQVQKTPEGSVVSAVEHC